MGVDQIRRRLKALLLALLDLRPTPSLIVIDNSPFHLGVGQAVESLFVELADPKTGTWKVKEKGKKGMVVTLRDVCVFGPDLGDVAAVFADLADSGRAGEKIRRWVMNRDRHDGGKCLLESGLHGTSVPLFRDHAKCLLAPTMLHVPFDEQLAAGGLSWLCRPSDTTGGKLVPNKEPYADGLGESELYMHLPLLMVPDPSDSASGKPQRWSESGWAYCSFREFLLS